jgi:hypothetical protein
MINRLKFMGISDLIFPIIITLFLYIQNHISETLFFILIPFSIFVGFLNFKFQPINKILESHIIKNKDNILKNIRKIGSELDNFKEITYSKSIKTEKMKISILAYSICIVMLIFVLQFNEESSSATVKNSITVNLFNYNYQWFFIQFFLFTLKTIMISKILSLIKTIPVKIIKEF